jgi:Cu+-exporting ATPase
MIEQGSCCGGDGATAVDMMLDPVCGMKVDPLHARHQAGHDGHTYYFCAARCREKFMVDPGKYVGDTTVAVTPVPDAIYTCPMHPEVQQVGPGDCPMCGMALEPVLPDADGDDSGELSAMAGRLWTLLALTLPVFVLAMGSHLSGWRGGSRRHWPPWWCCGAGRRSSGVDGAP